MKTPMHYSLPKSKAEAKKRGAIYYMDGKTCKNGHTSTKYTDSGKCVACTKANKEKHAFPDAHKNSAIRSVRERIEMLKETSDFEESWE